MRKALLAVPVVALALAGTARAATNVTWTTASTGTAVDGSGTWTATSTNFTTGSTNVEPVATLNNIIIGNTTGGFTVTLGQGRDLYYAASTLTFNQNYTLNANTVADGLSLSGGITVATGKTVTINSYISDTPALTVNSGSILNITGGGFFGAVNGATVAGGVGTVNIGTGAYDSFSTIGTGTNSFEAVTFGSNSTIENVVLRASTGFTVGGGQSTGTNTLDVANGSLVALLANTSGQTLNIGTGVAAVGGAGTATLTLDAANSGLAGAVAGEIDGSGAVLIGAGTVASSNGGNGTLNINGGSFTTGNGNVVIGGTGNANNVLTDTVNITGGIVNFKGLTFGAQTVGAAQNFKAGSTATLNLSGGTLFLGTNGITSTPATNGGLTSVFNFSGGTLVLAASTTSPQNFASVPIVLSGTGGTIQTNGADGGNYSTILNSTISSSGTAGITKTGSTGSLTLGGINTYTGPTTVDGGTLTEDFTKTATSSSSTASNYIAPTSGLVLGGSGTFNINGRGNATATPTVAGATLSTTLSTAAVVGQNTLALTSATGLVVGEGITGTGIPAGTYIVAISGTTVTLSSQLTAAIATGGSGTITAAPYVGTSTAGQTTFAVTSATGLTAGDVITGGNFAAGTYITSINGLLITVSSPATANAATGATFTAATTGTTSQTFATTTINPGNNLLTLNNVGAGTVLNLGTLSHNVGGTVNFTQPAGTVSATNGYTVGNSDGALVNGILGAWTTVGTGSTLTYATDAGTTGSAITAFTSTAGGANLVNVTGTTGNYSLTGNQTVASSIAVNTLQSTMVGATTALGANTLTVNGLMSADSSGTWNITATGTGGIIIGSSNELDLTGSSTGIAISAPISDNGSTPSSLVDSNGGQVTLSGANTYSGGTYLNAGSVLLSVAQNGTTSGPLGSGVGGAATSPISFNGGKIIYSASNNADYSARIVNSLGAVSMDLAGQTVTYATGLASSNTGGFTITTGVTGSGKLILSAANSYTGLTTISTGTSTATTTVQLTGSANLGALTNGLSIGNGNGVSTLDLHGTNQTVGTLNGTATGLITNTSATGSVLTVGYGNAGVSFSYGGNFTGNVGITKVGGASTLTLSAAGGASNNYSGTTTINAGTVLYTGTNSFASSSAVVVNDGGAIELNATGVSQATDTQNISLAGYGTQGITDALFNNTGTNTIGGNITLTDQASIGVQNNTSLTIGNTSGTSVPTTGYTVNTITTNGFNLFIDSASGALTINSSITGSGGLIKNGTTPNQLVLLNGNNTYTGNTVLQSGGGGSGSGGFQAGSTQAFGVNSALVMWKPATNSIQTIDLNGFNNSFGSLGGSTSLGFGTISLGGATLTTGGDNSNTNFGSDITSASTGSHAIGGGGGFTKIGTGTQTLSGANGLNFTGTTTVNGGTLVSVGTAAPASELITTNTGTASLNVTGMASTTGLYVGEAITGDGLAAGTYITGITSSSAITVNQSLNQVATGTATFGTVQGLGSGALVMGNVAGATLDVTGDLGGTTVASINGGGANGGNIILGAASLTTGTDNSNATYGGSISNATGTTGGLVKTGTGTQTFSGANTYSGVTSVNAGALLIDNTVGSATGTSAVTVASGAAIGGGAGAGNGGTLVTTPLGSASLAYYMPNQIGVIGSGSSLTVNSGAVVAPGNGGVGTLTVAALTLKAGSTLNYEFNGSANDFMLAGTANLDNTGLETFDLFNEGTSTAFAAAGVYDLIGYSAGGLTGSIASLAVGDQVAGFNYQFVNDTADNIIQLDITSTAAVPEPGTWALMIGGLALLVVIQRRRNKSC